jgi:hypothetical protein
MIRMRLCLFLTAMVLGTALPVFAALTVNGLRCEGVGQPEQVDTTTPPFSWGLETEVRAVRQVATSFERLKLEDPHVRSDQPLKRRASNPKIRNG